MVKLEYNQDLIWCSDWNGDEVGYPDVNVAGLYNLKGTDIYFYIDTETNTIIDGYVMEDE